ncbi:hypothetical protein [Microbacterium phyllosphaerae]
MSTTGVTRLVRGVAILAFGAAMVALSGCGAITKELSDGDFAETIPAALAESDIGVTDSFAAKGIDGFTFNLIVGVDLDHGELSADDLAGILTIVLQNNDVPSDQIKLSVNDVDGEPIDVKEVVEQINPDLETRAASYGDLAVTNDQAAAIVEAVWGE